MVENILFISIKEVASRLMRHPLMTDITLEAIILYTTDFIGIMGLPSTLIDKSEEVKIESYRAKLPCDFVYMLQVKDKKSNISLRSTTDVYYLDTPSSSYSARYESTFKIQGSIIYTTFKEGELIIAYKAMLLDKDGYPMIPDNSAFLRALEAFIKKEWFTILFDMNKISPAALLNALLDYAWRAGLANMQFTIPSVSEMESITNIMNQLLSRTTEFRSGFRSLGNKEYLKDLR